MGKFIRKLVCLICLPLIGNLFLAFLLPLDLFTFRAWETLRVFTPSLFNGPFYPNQRIEKPEVGDLAKGTPYAVPRPMLFITDDYGFRNREDAHTYNIVIVGDSMTAGSGLTQADTLSETLARSTGQTIYNYAPANLFEFLADSRFQDSPPTTVILQAAERYFYLLNESCPQTSYSTVYRPLANVLSPYLRTSIDTAVRNPFYLIPYLKSRFSPHAKQPIVNDTGMVFSELSIVPSEESIITPEHAVEALERCKARLTEWGMDLVFLPVPDKENVLFDIIPPDSRPQLTDAERHAFYIEVMTTAPTKGIPTVDLLTPFTQARAEGVIVYQLDDTHWNPTGVRIAVEEILPLLKIQ